MSRATKIADAILDEFDLTQRRSVLGNEEPDRAKLVRVVESALSSESSGPISTPEDCTHSWMYDEDQDYRECGGCDSVEFYHDGAWTPDPEAQP